MRRRAKELARQRQEAEKSGRGSTGMGGGGFGSSSYGRDRDTTTIIDTTPTEPIKPSYTAPRYGYQELVIEKHCSGSQRVYPKKKNLY